MPDFYDRGKTCQNRFEATTIIDEAMQRCPSCSFETKYRDCYIQVGKAKPYRRLNEKLKQHPDLDAFRRIRIAHRWEAINEDPIR